MHINSGRKISLNLRSGHLFVLMIPTSEFLFCLISSTKVFLLILIKRKFYSSWLLDEFSDFWLVLIYIKVVETNNQVLEYVDQRMYLLQQNLIINLGIIFKKNFLYFDLVISCFNFYSTKDCCLYKLVFMYIYKYISFIEYNIKKCFSVWNYRAKKVLE